MQKNHKGRVCKKRNIPVSAKEYNGSSSSETIKESKGLYVIKSCDRKITGQDKKALRTFFKRETNELNLIKDYPLLELKNVATKLDLPCAIFSTEWHPLDDELIQIAYKDHGAKINVRFSEEHLAMCKLKLLGRESYAIKRRAIELDLLAENIGDNRAGTIWSKYEILILKQQYPRKGCEIVELLDLGRSYTAIETKAKSLGLIYEETV